MKKKNKWIFALWGIVAAVAIAGYVCIKEYGDILWILSTTVLLWLILEQANQIQSLKDIQAVQNDVIREIGSGGAQLRAKDLEKKAECVLANCKMYLQRIRELKSENEQLKTINKNLIETKFKGKANGKKDS